MFKHSSSLLKSNLYAKSFFKFQNFTFARNSETFIPIYPGDKVIVLPPWGQNKLSTYAKKMINRKYKEEAKIQYGTVLRVMRKKGLVKVSRVNEQKQFVDPSKFLQQYETGNLDAIKHKKINLPVEISRVRLRDMTSDKTLKVLNVKTTRNEEGKRIRVNKLTKEEIPNPLLLRDWTYNKRVAGRKDGPKDTSAALRLVKTYPGENYDDIASYFIQKIKAKENIESKLVMKDKFIKN